MNWPRDWRLRATTVLALAAAVAATALTCWLTYRAVRLAFDAGGVAVQAAVVLVLLASGVAVVRWIGRPESVLTSLDASPAPPDHPDRRILRRLARQADEPTPDLWVAPRETPGAVTVGWRPRSTVVCVTDGALTALDADQREALLARELAHGANRDWAVLTAATIPYLPLAVVVLSVLAVSYVVPALSAAGVTVPGLDSLFLVGLGVLAVAIPVGAVGGTFVGRVARYRQLAADRGAVALTGDPAALATALDALDERIASMDDPDLPGDGDYTHLYPVPTDRGRYGSTDWQPDVEKRIDRLREMERNLESR